MMLPHAIKQVLLVDVQCCLLTPVFVQMNEYYVLHVKMISLWLICSVTYCMPPFMCCASVVYCSVVTVDKSNCATLECA